MNMAHTPEVSVIIPCFNSSDTIIDAVDSVLKQDGHSIEILVVDDGSTDNTCNVLNEYIKNGVIYYIKQNNKGPAAARNVGIRSSKGEYVCFLDADDLLYSNSIRDRMNVYKQYPNLGLVFTDNKKLIRKNGKDLIYRERDLLEINFIEDIAKKYIDIVNGDIYVLNNKIYYELILGCFIWTGTVLIRREILDDIGYFLEELRIAEDLDLWIRICRKYDIGYLNKSTAMYVLHEGGITKNIPLYYDSTIKVCFKYINDLPMGYRNRLKKQIALYYFNKGYYYYEKMLYDKSNDMFWQALRQDPFKLRYYIYSMLSHLP